MYLLAIIGTLMLIEGASEIDRARKKNHFKKKNFTHTIGYMVFHLN